MLANYADTATKFNLSAQRTASSSYSAMSRVKASQLEMGIAGLQEDPWLELLRSVWDEPFPFPPISMQSGAHYLCSPSTALAEPVLSASWPSETLPLDTLCTANSYGASTDTHGHMLHSSLEPQRPGTPRNKHWIPVDTVPARMVGGSPFSATTNSVFQDSLGLWSTPSHGHQNCVESQFLSNTLRSEASSSDWTPTPNQLRPSLHVSHAFTSAEISDDTITPTQRSTSGDIGLHGFTGYMDPIPASIGHVHSFKAVDPDESPLCYMRNTDHVPFEDEVLNIPTSPAVKSTKLQRRRNRSAKRQYRPNVPHAITWTGSMEWDVEVLRAHKFEDRHHACTWKSGDGRLCTARFLRSEHLKRHYRQHIGERPYKCPVSNCSKAIDRPDNANDHFKSHLKCPRRGQRNSSVQWPTLKALLLATFEPKLTRKMIQSIEKWIAVKTEGAAQRKYL